jgi:hypothetical protein
VSPVALPGGDDDDDGDDAVACAAPGREESLPIAARSQQCCRLLFVFAPVAGRLPATALKNEA